MLEVSVKKVNKEEVTVVTSLDVAETFNKEHKRVLQDIRELRCSEEFRLHNFVQSDYLNMQNHKQPMYIMTRDCFTQEELKAIQSKEMMVSGLIDCGWGYDQIKDFIQKETIKMIA